MNTHQLISAILREAERTGDRPPRGRRGEVAPAPDPEADEKLDPGVTEDEAPFLALEQDADRVYDVGGCAAPQPRAHAGTAGTPDVCGFLE